MTTRCSPIADVVIVHSRCWRAPHWTHEAGYLFEIRSNAAFRIFLGDHQV